MQECFGENLQQAIVPDSILHFMGLYDVLSASTAANYYSLPDITFSVWSGMVVFVQQAWAILPGLISLWKTTVCCHKPARHVLTF